jgi:hypothetical protein
MQSPLTGGKRQIKEKEMRKVFATICLISEVLAMSAGNIFGVEFKDGGTHNINYAIHNSDISVDSLAPGMQTTVNLLIGGILDHGYWTTVYEDGRVNIIGGNAGSLLAYGRSHATMTSGFAGDLVADNYSQVIISGGEVRSNLGSWGNSQVTLAGGKVGI